MLEAHPTVDRERREVKVARIVMEEEVVKLMTMDGLRWTVREACLEITLRVVLRVAHLNKVIRISVKDQHRRDGDTMCLLLRTDMLILGSTTGAPMGPLHLLRKTVLDHLQEV